MKLVDLAHGKNGRSRYINPNHLQIRPDADRMNIGRNYVVAIDLKSSIMDKVTNELNKHK